MNVLKIIFIFLLIFFLGCGNDGNGNDINTEENENISPIASIDFPLNSAEFSIDEIINFQSSGNDSDGIIVSYNWDFGDLITSTDQNPSHSYSSEGTYTIKLTVTDNDAANGTDLITIDVEYTNVCSNNSGCAPTSYCAREEGDCYGTGECNNL